MIAEDILQQISEFSATVEIDDAMIGVLREKYPDIHFNWCFDDDIGATAKPYSEGKGFNLYLVNSDNHCSCLTNDPEGASGVVIAEVIDDDF